MSEFLRALFNKKELRRTTIEKFGEGKIGYINFRFIEEDPSGRKVLHPDTPIEFQETVKSSLPIIKKRKLPFSKDIEVFKIKIGKKTCGSFYLEVEKDKFNELKGKISYSATDGLKPDWPEVKFVETLTL